MNFGPLRRAMYDNSHRINIVYHFNKKLHLRSQTIMYLYYILFLLYIIIYYILYYIYIIYLQKIKFRIEDFSSARCLRSAYFAQKLIIHFPKMFLPIGNDFLAVHPKKIIFESKSFIVSSLHSCPF